MRILIDECLDWRLIREFEPHTAVSVKGMGWTGLKNGELLECAEKEFDVFLTGDRNLSFQQRTGKFNIAIIVLQTGNTQLRNCLPMLPQVHDLLSVIKPGQVVVVSA